MCNNYEGEKNYIRMRSVWSIPWSGRGKVPLIIPLITAIKNIKTFNFSSKTFP
jgi:hypothetical protein